MAGKESVEEPLPTYKEWELVFKMVATDFELWKEYWGEGYTLDMYYDDHPERHPLAKYLKQLKEDMRSLTERCDLEDLLDRLGYYDDYHFRESIGRDYMDTYDDDLVNKYDELEQEDKPFIISLQELTGIDKSYLPPKEKLIPWQVVKLSMEMDLFLSHFEIFIKTPNYQDDFNYLLIRDYWDKPIQIEDSFNDFTWEDKMDEDVANW